MKRPISHETGEAAERIFETVLPDGWVKRKQHPDYGIDYQVEIAAKEELTGLGFAAQVKGTKDATFPEKRCYRVKTSHLTYYMKQRVPVYLFVVHVPTGTGFWVCLQEYVRENMRNQSWQEQKTVTVKFPQGNSLSDTDRLTKSVEKADKMMAELHPAAIPGAIKAERARLETLDPRFTIDIEATEYSTHTILHAKETVPISMTFLGGADRFKGRMRDLLGRGEPVEFAPGEIDVSGSPLFREMLAKGGKLQFTRNLRCTVDIETLRCEGADVTRIGAIPAKLTGGNIEYRIEAHLSESPFSVAMVGQIGLGSDGAVPSLSFTYLPDAWTGQPITHLAYFDALRDMFSALAKGARMKVSVSHQGNSLTSGTTQPISDNIVKGVTWLMSILHKARALSHRYGITPAYPKDFGHNEVEEIRDLWNFSHKIDRPCFTKGMEITTRLAAKSIDNLVAAALQKEGSRLVLQSEERAFTFLGAEVHVGRHEHVFTDVAFASTEQESKARVQGIRREGRRSAMDRIGIFNAPDPTYRGVICLT